MGVSTAILVFTKMGALLPNSQGHASGRSWQEAKVYCGVSVKSSKETPKLVELAFLPTIVNLNE